MAQDYRSIKRITKPMMEFKSFNTAKATIAGIELYKMLKKGQCMDKRGLILFEQF